MVNKIKEVYWKQHCKITCPNSEHCFKEHISDKNITIDDLRYCFIKQPRIGLGTYKEFFKEFLN